MNKKKDSSNIEFIKQVVRAGLGVITLILLLVVWRVWDKI